MALQMSPVDAHSSVNLVDEPLSRVVTPPSGTSSRAELPQCQLLECSSAEQVPLPLEQDPTLLPSLREAEQSVAAVGQEDKAQVVGREEEIVAVMASASAEEDECSERRRPRAEDPRGGAAPEALNPLEVFQSSVIVSSASTASPASFAASPAVTVGVEPVVHPGTHESHHNHQPCRLVDHVEVGSAAASSSSSNSLDDAQTKTGDGDDGLGERGDPPLTSRRSMTALSFNQSTSTFSGETNPPSATYADLVVSTSVSSPMPTSLMASSSAASPSPAHSAASAFDGDNCDSMETQIIEDSNSSSNQAAFLRYALPTGPASNRFWGIPSGAGLRGGAGETSLNNGAGTWGHPPASGSWGTGGGGGGGGAAGGSGIGTGAATGNATNPVQGQGWGAAASSAANVQRSSAASQGPPGGPPPGSSGPQPVSSNPQQQLPAGGQQQTSQGAWDQPKSVAQPSGSSPSQGVWAAQAAKNVPNQATNTNQDIITAGPLNLPQGGNGGGGGGGALGSSGPATPSSGKPDPLANYREVIYSQDGWGGNQVNQDTQWDVPNSPEPKDVPLWKQTASNGTEVWEVNLRNGGMAPPPIPQTKTPWGSHTPATNLGGTWGEDDETNEPSSMWTGVPANNGPTNWAANPMAGPLGAGPMGGPTAGPSGAPGIAGAGMTAGNGMWGGPKKEPEWAGGSAMQAGPGGWGDVRPTQRMGMPGPETMGMPAPAAPSHWPGPQNKAVPGQWSGPVPPVKDMKPTGWDEHSPPSQKRPIHNYDDGTAVWGNPSQMQQQPGSGVCRWKDMPNPNVAGGRGGMQQTGPPPGRMPPGPGMKSEMSWPGGQTRNGSWGDASVADQGNMWMDDKPMGVGGASWSEPPQTPTPWAKPKTPTTPSWGGGGETDDGLSWGQPPKPTVLKPLAKEVIWGSKQFRILSDMGFKKDDVENVLRNCNMVMEDALEMLRSGRMGMFGDDHVGSAGGGGYDAMGPHGGAPYPPGARFNPAQQMPFVHPGGGGAAHHLLNNPASSMGMNPNPAYKLLQAQQPPPMPPQVNQSQMVRNMGRVDSGVTAGGGGGAGSQPSPSQLRILVQQIQMAVQAGHLNPQILNQPLAPQTLVLLNQLLQQIKVLQQFVQQHTMALNRTSGGGPMGGPGMMPLVSQMNKTKQQIASLQQQIAAQQALYVKQQQGGGGMMNQPPGAPPGQGSDLFKMDSVHGLQSNIERMSLQDSGQSRLSQWKYPPMDKDMDLGLPEFSRAPGSIGGGAPPGVGGAMKPPLGSSLSSPNMNPVLGQDGGAWSSLSRSQSETGWPDSGTELSATPLTDGKDSWSTSTGTSSYAASISDLVPEFEPGKPWKGPQIKTADDDPTLTPGTFAMSGLGNESDVYSNNGSKAGSGASNASKSSPPPTGIAGTGGSGGGSGSGGESGFPTLGLSSATWSFNASSASTGGGPSTGSSVGAPYNTSKAGPSKSTWSDAPPPSADPWSAPNKPRGPPPGITTAGTGSQVGPKPTGTGGNGGGRDWSSSGTRSPWPGSGPSGAGSAGSWGGSLNGSSSWLVLRNLTPQIDGSTLKTLCVQHGPLHHFHLYLSHGVALVRYSTGEEAAKAQNALNNCVLGNTTIYADLANESDVQGWLQQLGMPAQQQQPQQQTSASGSSWGVRGSTPGTGGNGNGGSGNGNGGGGGGNTGKASANAGGDNNWGASGSGGGGGGGGSGGGGPASSPWSTGPSSVWSTPSPSSLNASLNSFLPGDLLGNESM